MTFTIDFDDDAWLSELGTVIAPFVPQDLRNALRTSQFRFQEDVLDAFAAGTDIEAIVDATLAWIRSNRVRVFHGTRLTDAECTTIKTDGIHPLNVSDRVRWLKSSVPELDGVLTEEFVEQSIQQGNMQHRERQLHAAISSKLILDGYDYLFMGSEFDRRLLEHAGRGDLVHLLTTRGKPRVIHMVVEGDQALDALHPFFPLEYTRQSEGYPNFVRTLLQEYAWLMYQPSFKRVGVDVCLMFRSPIPSYQIEEIRTVETGSL